MTENAIATEIVDAAFRIHTTLGPCLLESVYDTGEDKVVRKTTGYEWQRAEAAVSRSGFARR